MSDQQRLDVGTDPVADPEDRHADDESEPPRIQMPDSEPVEYPGGDGCECTYLYVESVCENHPNPPGDTPEGHLHASSVLIDGDSAFEDLLIEKTHSVECSACDGDIDRSTVRSEWPPSEPTPEDVLEVFRESNGQIALECYPDDRDRRFYIGEIGGRYLVETDHHETPDLPTGVDDLPALVEKHPTILATVDGTPLEGAYEDLCNGVGR
ncbi:hypothetical protein [Natrinema thermotolerans]